MAVLEDRGEGGVGWGVVLTRVHHSAIQGHSHHRKCLWVACTAVSNRSPFNFVFLGGEEKTGKFCLGGDAGGGCGGVVVLVSGEEMHRVK